MAGKREIRRPRRFLDSAPEEDVEATICDQWPVERLLDKRERVVLGRPRKSGRRKPRTVTEYLVQWQGDFAPSWTLSTNIGKELKREWLVSHADGDSSGTGPVPLEHVAALPPLDVNGTPELAGQLETLYFLIRSQLKGRTSSSEGFSGRAVCYTSFAPACFRKAFFEPYVERARSSGQQVDASFDFDEGRDYELSLTFGSMDWVLRHFEPPWHCHCFDTSTAVAVQRTASIGVRWGRIRDEEHDHAE